MALCARTWRLGQAVDRVSELIHSEGKDNKQEEMKITKIFHGEVRTQSLNERKGKNIRVSAMVSYQESSIATYSIPFTRPLDSFPLAGTQELL